MIGEPGAVAKRPPFEVQANHRRGEGIPGTDGIDDASGDAGFF